MWYSLLSGDSMWFGSALAYIRVSERNEVKSNIMETYTIEECVDFALQNELVSGHEGLWMSRGVASVYSDGYGVSYEAFTNELFKRGWIPSNAPEIGE